jgi:hypothetical protein
MMEAARSLGFAARCLTGYVYVPERDGPTRLGGGSTHAWCQIYVPGSGWVEFDPTNGIVGNRDLIRVGVARTPEQAIPLSGTDACATPSAGARLERDLAGTDASSGRILFGIGRLAGGMGEAIA